MGYISTNTLSRYMLNNCAYKINDAEISHILSRYDKDGDYRISFDEFMREVAPHAEDE
jgi:Ca2+-binding EF-hand superfamily protein